VLFRGFVDKAEKTSALVDSEVFVTPKFSGFPTTFLESCAVNCPIVTISSELDWVHNTIGYVAENSSFGLSKPYWKFSKPQISQGFRNNCRQTIRNFEISASDPSTRRYLQSCNRCDFCLTFAVSSHLCLHSSDLQSRNKTPENTVCLFFA